MRFWHAWATMPNIGWIPVDPADVMRYTAREV